MEPPPVALRPISGDVSVPRRGTERLVPHRNLVALGLGIGAALLATAAPATPNSDWPPAESVPLESLASSQYWPSDIAYGYQADATGSSTDAPGQWWLYSFVPERATTAVVLRQPDLPAGLSVDAAWQHTRGDPSVIVAILDDGVDLTSADLKDGIYLNVGELKEWPLHHADGSLCAPLDSSVADSPRVDCSDPPDGILTISDFAETLGWLPDVTGFDPNGNGILDPQDLLLSSYADGLDNDGNGFVDDLVGWDFVDFDNDPSPVYVHSGTEAALDAVARANNDIDRAGVCPNCRALPIRVGHQRGASSPGTALGLLYASAIGATAALVGHLPQGRTHVLDAAVRTAAQRNLLTLLVHDGEQQTSLAQHFDSDAVRVIGTLTQLNGTTTTTGSFTAPDPCQTLESTPTLYAAAPSCSRRGPAVALGIAGMAASAMKSLSTNDRPTALELGALLAHSADNVAPESAAHSTNDATEDTSVHRLNTHQAVTEAIADVVPPELELESPLWLETVVLDNLALPLSVVGRVNAPRAETYDVIVELAAGSNPTDSDFETVSEQTGRSSTMPLGEGSVLGELDLRTWYNAHFPASEQVDRTGVYATLRVRAVAHLAYEFDSSGQAQDVEAEVRRQLVLITDDDLMAGFPYALGAMPTAPRIADLDRNGSSKIVIGTLDGRLFALAQTDGTVTDSFGTPVQTKLLPAYEQLIEAATSSDPAATPAIFAGSPPVSPELGREPIVGPVALADLTRDGNAELVFTTSTGRIYVVRSDGSTLDGWPRCIATETTTTQCSTAGVESAPQASPPVLVDIDGDNRYEIVVATTNGVVYAFESDASVVNGWPVHIETPDGNTAQLGDASPAAADMNGDQIPDLVLSFGEPRDPLEPDTAWYVTILGATSPDGPQIATQWPVATLSYDFMVDRYNRTIPPPAIDASGSSPRALLYGNATSPFFLPILPGNIAFPDDLPGLAEPSRAQSGERGFSLLSTGADSTVDDAPAVAPLYARPVLGDLDRDGKVDLILPAATVSTLESLRSTSPSDHRGLLAFWSGNTGEMLPGSPIVVGDLVGSAPPIVADLTNDGYPEVIATDGAGALVAYDACGRSPPGWPKIVGGSISQSPAVGDVDGDDLLEVVAATDDGRIFAWNTEASAQSFVPWGTALHDNLNQSAHYAPMHTRPDYPGTISLSPSGACLTPQADESEVTAELSARGGCTCNVVDGSTSARSWHAPLIALVAWPLLRSRRRLRQRCLERRVQK